MMKTSSVCVPILTFEPFHLWSCSAVMLQNCLEMRTEWGRNQNCTKYVVQFFLEFFFCTRDLMLHLKGSMVAMDISIWAVSLLTDKVIPLKNSNLDQVLNTSHRPSAIYFSKWDRVLDVFKSLSGQFDSLLSEYKVNIFHTTKKEDVVVKHFNVTDYPTLLVLKMDGSVVKYSSTTYNWKELHAFLLSHAYRLMRHITPTTPKSKPMVFNPQSRKGWNNLCPRAVGGKCFVTFLDPHASNHDESLSTLQLLANHFPSLPVMWLDVTLLYPFKQQFKLKGHVYPQV
eukprot:TRINITY_DN3869_c0_g1_i14.p1 TRINITY_DN3869_c0_g1~~TRINITY_DN3869_c0_g1_i14.p1  ORF type:complete len:285 (+),score=27.83 TRINITY_DN3869_c0_g1_i14:246-1100(+)